MLLHLSWCCQNAATSCDGDRSLVAPNELHRGPSIVRAPVLAAMLLLAKFLGYITTFAHNEGLKVPSTGCCAEPLEEIQPSNEFVPDFDLYELLDSAIRQGKLLITLPWLVQYLIMLDTTALEAANSKAALELLSAIYAAAGIQSQTLQPSAHFLLRCCIGRLLDAQPPLIANYHSFRAQEAPALVEQCLNTIRVEETQCASPALLELLLPIASPFRPDFLVAMAVGKPARHTTMGLDQFSSKPPLPGESQPSTSEQQRKLFDAFLHTQTSSVRRLLEFVVERSYKCVISDAQQRILLPSKAAAEAQANAIGFTDKFKVLEEVQSIYSEAREQACEDWQQQVPAMLEQRIQMSLRALLPQDINDQAYRTYKQQIRRRVKPRIQKWLEKNVRDSGSYMSNVHDVTKKLLCRNRRPCDTELQLSTDHDVDLSDLIYTLQKLLHYASREPERLPSGPELLDLVQRAERAFLLQHLPIAFYYQVGSDLVQLLQLLMCRQTILFTPRLISCACNVWRAPKMPVTGDSNDPFETLGIFEALITDSFIKELSATPNGFLHLQQLLLSMLAAEVIDINLIHDLFMNLFKESSNIPDSDSKALSDSLRQLALGSSKDDASVDEQAKSRSFTEMLSHFLQDLDL